MTYAFRCPHCGVRLEADYKQVDRDMVCGECDFKFVAPVTGIMAGVTTDGFWVKRRITGSSVSEIFETQKTETSEKLLLKVLCPLMTVDNEEGDLDAYLAWIERAREVEHPNWVATVENGLIMEHHYLAYPMVGGTCLDAYIEQHGAMAERDALKATLKVARVLGHAWDSEAALHLGLKPSNLLLDPDQQIFLLDPGHYRLLLPLADPELQRLSGWPANYFAPEQILGQLDLDMRTDMYMLGATLYYLATGEAPYGDGDVAEVFGKVLEQPPPVPSEAKEGLSERFDDLVTRLMAKDRDDRYASWDDVVTAIKQILKGTRKSTTQTHMNLVAPSPDSGTSPNLTTGVAGTPPSSGGSSRTLIIGLVAILVAAVALLVGVVIFASNSGGDPAPPPSVQQPTEDPKLAALEKRYQDAMIYIQKNPDDYAGAVKLLRDLRSDGLGTEYQQKAHEALQQLRADRDKAGDGGAAAPGGDGAQDG